MRFINREAIEREVWKRPNLMAPLIDTDDDDDNESNARRVHSHGHTHTHLWIGLNFIPYGAAIKIDKRE